MPDDTLLPFPLPAIKAKKVIAAFDGGRLSSDGGVSLLALAEKRVGIIERLCSLFPDERDPDRVTHPLGSIIGARIFAIGCGYEDGNNFDHLRRDPAFKLTCGRTPSMTSAVSCQSPWLALAAGQPERNVYDTERSRPVAVILRPGKHRVGLRSVVIFVAWSDVYGGIGQRRGSRFAATATMPVPK